MRHHRTQKSDIGPQKSFCHQQRLAAFVRIQQLIVAKKLED
jgi:hypothetical protein